MQRSLWPSHPLDMLIFVFNQRMPDDKLTCLFYVQVIFSITNSYFISMLLMGTILGSVTLVFFRLSNACPQMDVGSSSWGCHCIWEEALSSAFLPKHGPDGSVSMHYCAPDCCLTKPLRTWMYKCVGLWRSCCVSMALCCHVKPQFAYDVAARLLAEPKNDLSPSLFCYTSMQ